MTDSPSPTRVSTDSLGRMFLDRVASSPTRPAFSHPTPGGWTTLTWAETEERVSAVAAGLLALGVRPEDRVAITSSTRLEWVLADLAAMCAGAAVTTVYPSTSTDDVAFILTDSGSRVVFAEDATQVAKMRERREQIPSVETVVLIDGEPDAQDGGWVITLGDLEARGAKLLADTPTAVRQATTAVQPDHLATIIYTSGTTGRPKGVELTHANWVYEGDVVDALKILTPDDVQFLWLPLAHSFGKVLLAAQMKIGFSTAVDGRVDQIVENLATIKPTFMAGVPRIFEKVYGRVVSMVREEGGPKLRIFDWAFRVGHKASRLRAAGKQPTGVLALEHRLADRLVFSTIKARMGGRIRFFVSGSAALSRDVAEWFDAAGLVILEGYGLTETSAGTTLSLPGRVAFGAVGEPFPGTDIKIADDGEILLRGGGVMRGYHGLPEQTAEVLLEGGWFATGDVGEVDSLGRLRITDRKKDLIKTSGGKYIAPQAIEAQFKAICPIASQMFVTARNFASALITLDAEGLASWARAHDVPADYAAASQDPRTTAYVQTCVDELNARLNKWESIKQFRILDRDLSIEEGELTPSLKVKRKVVEAKFSAQIDSMYNR